MPLAESKMGSNRGLRRLTYANGSKSYVSRKPRSTKVYQALLIDTRTTVDLSQARGFQSCRSVTFATVTSYTNPPETGNSAIITRGVSTSMSRNAVFNTNELLELILLHLTIEDVLTVRHVDHHWNLLIVRSSRLKRHLFLRQKPSYGFFVFDRETEILRAFHGGDILRFGSAWADRQNVALPSIINPVIFKQNTAVSKGSLARRAKFCESMYLRASPNLKNMDSIMQEMFLSLPAPREVEFKIYYFRGKFKGRGIYRARDWVRGRVANKYGVTLGDVIDKFLVAVDRRAVNESPLEYVVCAKASVVWMMGHIFPTAGEWEEVSKLST